MCWRVSVASCFSDAHWNGWNQFRSRIWLQQTAQLFCVCVCFIVPVLFREACASRSYATCDSSSALQVFHTFNCIFVYFVLFFVFFRLLLGKTVPCESPLFVESDIELAIFRQVFPVQGNERTKKYLKHTPTHSGLSRVIHTHTHTSTQPLLVYFWVSKRRPSCFPFLSPLVRAVVHSENVSDVLCWLKSLHLKLPRHHQTEE